MTAKRRTSVETLSKREASKADRRRRIIDAARSLLQETGEEGLSMRALATRAQVSINTPYNLFGSKRAIVLAVLDDVREFHERFASAKNLTPIDRIFRALSLTLGYHVDQPGFYRTIWSSLLGGTNSTELRAELIQPQSDQIWRGLLEEAVLEGSISKDIDLKHFQRVLGNIFAGAILTWVMGGCEVEELEPMICYGYAVALAGVITRKEISSLRKRILEFQGKL